MTEDLKDILDTIRDGGALITHLSTLAEYDGPITTTYLIQEEGQRDQLLKVEGYGEALSVTIEYVYEVPEPSYFPHELWWFNDQREGIQ